MNKFKQDSIKQATLLMVAYECFFLLIYTTAVFAEQIFFDEIGEELVLTKTPQRIVSLAPSITEILFALGAGDRIVGVTDFCDYPEEAKRKERVGGFINPNIEKILSLKPEIVFATKDGNDPSVVRRLKKFGIPVYVANQRNFEGLLKSMLMISEILGLQDRGKKIVDEIRARKERIEHKVKEKKRVLFLYSTDPLIGAGPDTLADNLITLAGGINIIADSPMSYPKINLEEAIARKPDVVIITEMNGEGPQDIKRLEGVLGKRLKWINGDIVNRPGPRLIEGLEELYKIIHEAEK